MSTPQFGVGRHVLLVTNVEGIVRANLVEAATYSCNLMFTKLSILALYHRIFSLQRGWIPTLWVSAGFVIALGITQPFVYIFHCIPIQWSWAKNTPDMKCIDFSLGMWITRCTTNVLFGFFQRCSNLLIISQPSSSSELSISSRTGCSSSYLFQLYGVSNSASVPNSVYARCLLWVARCALSL